MSAPPDERGLFFSALKVIEEMPSPSWAADKGADREIFERLRGAEILKIGMPSRGELEGGGLIIDYLPKETRTKQRLVFAFNEHGMWLVWDSLEISGRR